MIFDLVKDFADVLEAMPEHHPRRRILKLLDEAIRRDVHFINRHPTTFFQCLWNTCWSTDLDTRSRDHLPTRQNSCLPHLLKDWRRNRTVNRLWLRNVRPPSLPLGMGSRLSLPRQKNEKRQSCFAFDDQALASVSSTGPLELWDRRSGALKCTIPLPDNIRGKAIATTDHAVAILDSGSLYTLESEDGQLTRVFVDRKRDLRTLAASDDALVVSSGRELVVLDASGRARQRFCEHEYRRTITALNMTPSCEWLASIDIRNLIVVSRLDEGRYCQEIVLVPLCSDEDQDPETLKLVPLDDWTREREYPYQGLQVSLSPNGRHLAVFGGPFVWVFELPTLRRVYTARNTGHSVYFAEFTPDGSSLAFPLDWIHGSKPVAIVSLAGEGERSLHLQQDDSCTGISFSFDGETACVSSNDGSLTLIELADATTWDAPLDSRDLPEDEIIGVITAPSNALLAVWSIDHHVTVLRVSTGEIVFDTGSLGKDMNDEIVGVFFSPSSEFVAVLQDCPTREQRLTVWHVTDGQRVFDSRGSQIEADLDEHGVFGGDLDANYAFDEALQSIRIACQEIGWVVDLDTGKIVQQDGGLSEADISGFGEVCTARNPNLGAPLSVRMGKLSLSRSPSFSDVVFLMHGQQLACAYHVGSKLRESGFVEETSKIFLGDASGRLHLLQAEGAE